MNYDPTNINEQIPPSAGSEEKIENVATTQSTQHKDYEDENFSIFDNYPQEEEREEVKEKENRNNAPIENQTRPDEKKPLSPNNNPNQNDSQNNQLSIMYSNMINFLKNVQEMSYLNDENSVKFFEENTSNTIKCFLTSNLEYLKITFTFFVNYVQIRINHIESMPNNELAVFFKIFEPNYPFYMNIGNNTDTYTREVFENLLRDVFVSSFPSEFIGVNDTVILKGEFKNIKSANYFYKYMLTSLLHTNFFPNFIKYLGSPAITLEYEKFYYIYNHLASMIHYYDEFDKELILALIKSINFYYEQMFLNNQIKDMNKYSLENFLRCNLWNDYSLLEKFSNESLDIEKNDIFMELLMKDLNTIYFLVQSQNLERRVLGFKSLNEIIPMIYAFEKYDEKLSKQVNANNMEFLHRLILVKKKKLMEWLDKINIFNIIFGENMHEAILGKSSLILIFLYVNSKLSFEQIDYIWKISQDKHEAISASILNIYSDLISSLSIEHAMHILKIIYEIPFKEVSDVTIKILDSFSNNKYLVEQKDGDSIKNQTNINFEPTNNVNSNMNIEQNLNNQNEFNMININKETGFDFLFNMDINNNSKDVEDFKTYYLKIIWKFCSENSFYSGLSSQIIQKARKVISSILLKPVFKYELAKYIKKCITGIGYNHHLTTCLSILDMIIKNMKQLQPERLKEILSSFGNEIIDVKTFLNYLDKQYSLVSTILHAMINVKSEVMIIAGEVISIQNNLTSLDVDKNSINMNDVMNNLQIKFLEPNDKIFKNLKEEIKEFDFPSNMSVDNSCNNFNFNKSNKDMVNERILVDQYDEMIECDNNNNNLLSELDKINIIMTDSNSNFIDNSNRQNNDRDNNNIAPNLDETLSTEKSMDDTISTISTDISAIEKSRMFIVKDFIENNLKFQNNYNLNAPYFEENYHLVFKRLKMNFSNANYYTLINSILEFFKSIIFSSSIQISQIQIEYLFTLLVENSVEEEEMNLFYSFFAEIFRYQNITKQNYLSEDNFNFILFDILLKIEISTLPYSAFVLFKQIFFYINSSHKNLTINSQNIADVRDFSQLIGFETLWKFFIETKNTNIYNDTQGLLVNLISTMAKRDDNKESFLFIFDKIFENLEFNLNQLKQFKSVFKKNSNIEMVDLNLQAENLNQPNIRELEFEEQTNKLINLLFIVNSTKQKFEKKVQEITLSILNHYNSNGKKSDISCSLDTKIKDLKALIISKVLFPSNIDDINSYTPIIDEKKIMLISRGQILNKEDLTLRCVKLKNGSLIQVHKGESEQMDVQIEEGRLNMLVSTIKSGMDQLEDEVIKRALKKYNYDPDETFMALTDDLIVADIRAEIKEENVIVIDDVQSKFGLELFNEQKMDLLVSLLDLESISINKNIWQLLSAIKFPDKLINSLSQPEYFNFKFIFDVENPNKMLIFLRIINCLVFNDNSLINVTKLDENKKSEWKINLLISDGVSIMLETCGRIIDIISKADCNREYCLINSYILGLSIITKWLHYLTFSATISISQNRENLSWLIKQIINKRPQGIHTGISTVSNNNPENNSTQKTSSNATPTFGSPHSSFSAGDKKATKSFSILGAEEYDNNYEEEVANSLFVKLITTNFHISIIKFIIFASNKTSKEKFHSENEVVYLNLLEILIILNEMNPDSFKDLISIEFEKSIILNLLFVEKSKYIRKVVENLFIILSQSKSNDSLLINSNQVLLSLKSKEFSSIKSIKEIIMIHILNNYQRIYSGQVYEEFFNLFGFMLHHTCEGKDSNSWEKIFGEEFNVTNLAYNILNAIYTLSFKYDTELSDIELEQLNGNIYLLQCLCANNENVILKTLEKFTDANQSTLVNFLFNNLFHIEKDEDEVYNPEHVRFKYSSKNLRSKVYNLLTSLMKIRENYKRDLALNLIGHHTSFKNENFAKLELDIPVRNKYDRFIGLRNYGATCYLNSLLQQLYMIPAYRNGIHSVPVLENTQIFTNLEENPLYQLQLVFANLSYSLKQFHLPLDFIKSFKAFNNEPINVFKQQDCLEFFLILNDHLENIAKEVNKEHIFDDSIRGRFTMETISLEKEYPYYSEREEPFLSISLDIKNKKTLEDALDLFVKPEVLEGENKYHCEQYGKKISIMRRLSIKKMPPNVIINLKRFELDYNTFERIKLNDYCEFPTLIDFKPWTRAYNLSQNRQDPNINDLNVNMGDDELREFIDPDGFKYQLTGVLIHSGSIDQGHYYSFIYDMMTGKWHKYDDSKISEFNIKDLKIECFGEDNSNNNSDFISRSNNAYLLFYTKVSEITNYKFEEKISKSILNQIKQENMLFLKYKNYMENDYFIFLREILDFTILKNNKVEKLSAKEKSMSKIDRLKEEITKETLNVSAKNELYLDQPLHFDKIKNIYFEIKERLCKEYMDNKNMNTVISSDRSLSKKMIKMAVYFFFDIVIQQKDTHKTNSYANFIRELLEKDRNCAAWFLKKLILNTNLFIEHILSNNRSEIRESLSRIILNCINSLYSLESKYIKEKFEYLTLTQIDSKEIFVMKHEYRSCLMRFFKNNILDVFDTTRAFWPNFSQFMQIILECMNNNLFEIYELSIEENLYVKLIYLLMNNQRNFETTYQSIGSKALDPNFGLIVDIISTMTLSGVTQGIYNLNKYSRYSKYQNFNQIVKMSDDCLNLILNYDVIINNILRKYCNEGTQRLIHHLCWGDLETSIKLINYMISTTKEDLNTIVSMIKNANGFLEIDDPYSLERIKAFYCLDDVSESENDSLFNYLMSYRDESSFNVVICLKLLGEYLSKSELVFNYLINFNLKIVWVYFFIKDITSNSQKYDALRIEASSEGYNLSELINIIDEIYLNKLKIRNLVDLPNQDLTFSQNRDLLNDNNMTLDYEKFTQGINNNFDENSPSGPI